MSDIKRWPTPAEVDAERDRWWWVDGEPSRLHVDRMEHPHRVMWHTRHVEDLPIDMFGGPVRRPGEVPLGPVHSGWRMSLRGLLAQARDQLKRSRWRDFHAESLDQLTKHVEDLAVRYYGGELEAVDGFLQLYAVDVKRPKVADHG